MRELGANDVSLTDEVVGRGSSYRIMRAIHDGMPVAAKAVISASDVDTRVTDTILIREHENLEKLDHAAIPRSRGLWRDPKTGLYYHIMELRRGRTLAEIVTACVGKHHGEGGRLWSDVVTQDILGQALSALAHAHARSVFHNDVTPSNIVVDLEADGELRVSLVDFEAAGEGSRGSVPYTAPERMEGAPASAQSDIYSAAVLVFYVLSGLLPWPTRQPEHALKERASSRLDDLPSDLSREAWRLIKLRAPPACLSCTCSGNIVRCERTPKFGAPVHA